MNSKKIKVLIISIILFAIIMFTNGAYAASSKITSSATSVKVGDTITVTITGNAASWQLNLSANGPVTANGATSFSDATSSGENENVTMGTVTYKATGEGNVTFNLSGKLVDGDYSSSDASGSASVKVVAQSNEQPKQTETPAATPTEKPAETPKQDTPKQEPQKPAEPAFKEVNETVYVNPEKVSSVNVRQGYTTSTTLVGSIKAGESVTRTGIGDNGWSRIKYNGQTAYVISSALTTEKPEEKEETSTNKALKELSIKGYELSPAFDAETTSYSITLKEDEKKLDITATAADEKAKVEITGNDNLENPNNTVRITVTAEDGTQRIYRISVLKNEETRVVEMVKLKSLQVANATLSPEFDPDTVSYVIEVENPSSITAKDVVATAEDDDVNVTIAEASESSENGEKKITIVLESKDGSVSTTYEIFVKKPVANHLDNLMQNKSDKTIYMILGGIIAVLVILIIVIIILLKKTGDRDDGDETEMDGADEMSDDYDYSLKNAIDEVNRGEDTEYDDMLKESRAKTQILSMDYNVFKDTSDDVGLGQDEDEVEEDDDGNVEEDDDLEIKPKKRGKHF